MSFSCSPLLCSSQSSIERHASTRGQDGWHAARWLLHSRQNGSGTQGDRKRMSEPSDLIPRARALHPLIARESDEIERTRRLTQPVVAALIENGLYRMMLPRSLGGSEVPLATFM